MHAYLLGLHLPYQPCTPVCLFICRSMFPYGLPSQFSFVSTFRMNSRTRRETWDLLRIEDILGQPQFGVRLNGKRKEIQLYMPDYKNEIQTVSFRRTPGVKSVSIFFIYFHQLAPL